VKLWNPYSLVAIAALSWLIAVLCYLPTSGQVQFWDSLKSEYVVIPYRPFGPLVFFFGVVGLVAICGALAWQESKLSKSSTSPQTT